MFQVKIWFQNRRTKWKKQDNISNAEAAEHKVHINSGEEDILSSSDEKISTREKPEVLSKGSQLVKGSSKEAFSSSQKSVAIESLPEQKTQGRSS